MRREHTDFGCLDERLSGSEEIHVVESCGIIIATLSQRPEHTIVTPNRSSGANKAMLNSLWRFICVGIS